MSTDHTPRVDVSEHYRPPRGPVPDVDTAPLAVPDETHPWERSEGHVAPSVIVDAWVSHGRRMLSPEVHTVDPFGGDDSHGGTVRVSAASGATREHSLSEHLASLGAHTVTVRRTRKGRSTFTVRRHGRLRAPILAGMPESTSAERRALRLAGLPDGSGLAGADSIMLAALADGMLRSLGVECVEYCAGKGRTRPLLGTTVRAFAQVTPSLVLTGSAKRIARAHAHSLRYGAGMVGDACGVARHTADLAGWINGVRRDYLSAERRDHEHGRMAWPIRSRFHGRIRASERASFTRLADTAQYVSVADPSQCVAWHPDSERMWVGHTLTARSARASGRRYGRVPSTAPTAPVDPECSERVRAILAHDWSTGPLTLPLADGATLTVRRTSDRYGSTVRRQGRVHASWQARTPVSAARIPSAG